jgi:hypothetical protein
VYRRTCLKLSRGVAVRAQLRLTRPPSRSGLAWGLESAFLLGGAFCSIPLQEVESGPRIHHEVLRWPREGTAEQFCSTGAQRRACRTRLLFENHSPSTSWL